MTRCTACILISLIICHYVEGLLLRVILFSFVALAGLLAYSAPLACFLHHCFIDNVNGC